MRLIPFTQRFEGRKADADLPAKLREELSGVLTWAVEGCVEWNQHGLGSAAAVDKAPQAYRAETEVTERFFEDECVFGEDYAVSKKGLYEAWVEWCDQEGVDPGTQVFFTRTMGQRGSVKNFNDKNVDRTTRGWRGIGLRKDPIVVSEGKLLQGKNSCKQRRRETSVQQLSENFQKPLEDSPYEKGFEKDRKKLLQGEKLLQEVVTAPLSWEEDGLTIRYMPEGE